MKKLLKGSIMGILAFAACGGCLWKLCNRNRYN